MCIRYEPSKELEARYGNIGYGVRPLQRNKGYATQMLLYALEVCKNKGLEKVVVGCRRDNLASSSVIRKCDGVMTGESIDPETGSTQYFEIRLDG